MRDGWREGIAITGLKLVLQSLAVRVLARVIGLTRMGTQAIVMPASISVTANAYLLADQFKAMKGPIAYSMVLPTVLAAFTTPIASALTAQLQSNSSRMPALPCWAPVLSLGRFHASC